MTNIPALIKIPILIGYRLTSQIFDIKGFIRFIPSMLRYFNDFWTYRGLSGEAIPARDIYPILNEDLPASPIDPHYYYVNGWAMRRILANRPSEHFDFASQVILTNLLSAVVPCIYFDFRPLKVKISGLKTAACNLTNLDIQSESAESISCLHVLEHIGLGRYGDPLDVHGSLKGSRELTRILKPGGYLYFAVPTGRERVCFNAHRVFQVESVLKMFSGLELVELSGVTDAGDFIENISVEMLNRSEYACGFYIFKKEKK
jgi:hypothetical protein